MDPMERTRPVAPSVGERIESRRIQNALSRRVVANLVGRSEEWLRLVEAGRLRLDSIDVMIRLARVLRIEDFRELIDWPTRSVRPALAMETDLLCELRLQVLDHPVISMGRPEVSSVPARHLDLRLGLHRCEVIWAGRIRRYSLLAQELPVLLADTRHRYRESMTSDDGDLLIEIYRLCRELCSHLGAHDLALIVADRAMLLASRHSRSALLTTSAYQVAMALLWAGRSADARRYATAVAAKLQTEDITRSVAAGHRSATLQGALHLLAASAASATLDAVETERSLAEADRIALKVGRYRQVHGIGFGVHEVELMRMEIALTRTDFEAVLGLAGAIDLPDNYPVEKRVRYHVMAAAAFASRRDDMGGVFELLKAVEASDEDLRYDPDAQRTVQILLRRDNKLLRRDLVRLAVAAGINARLASG